MKTEDFLNGLFEELELEESIDMKSSMNLTSLMQLSLISFLDEYFGIRVNAKDLSEIDSVEKLVELIGKDKIE
ncbi:phosphopantetheine-binding protein [Bacteroidota bacterium]